MRLKKVPTAIGFRKSFACLSVIASVGLFRACSQNPADESEPSMTYVHPALRTRVNRQGDAGGSSSCQAPAVRSKVRQ